MGIELIMHVSSRREMRVEYRGLSNNSQQQLNVLLSPSQQRILPLESIPFIHHRIPQYPVPRRDPHERFVVDEIGELCREER